MNCILETKRTLTTESLTVFIQQEMGLLSSQSGVCKHSLYVYILACSLWALFKWEGKKVQEGNSLLERHTQNFTCGSRIVCLKEQVSPPRCCVSQRVQEAPLSPSASFIQQPFIEHDYRTVTTLGSRVTTVTFPSFIGSSSSYSWGSTSHHYHYHHYYHLSSLRAMLKTSVLIKH